MLCSLLSVKHAQQILQTKMLILNQHFKKKKLKRKIHSFEINSFFIIINCMLVYRYGTCTVLYRLFSTVCVRVHMHT